MADILVIDDDANLRMALEMTLKQESHTCRLAENVEAGWAQFQAQTPDLALVDMQLPDGDGLELLERLRGSGFDQPIIVMTAFGTVTSAVTAMKHGAVDFIEKPLSVKEMCRLIVQMLKGRELSRQIESTNGSAGESALIGKSAGVMRALSLAEKVARLETQPGVGLVTTLVRGGTGTATHLLARNIHQHMRIPDGPYIHVNCTAIPENLLEMELFGHERGVFTDAKASKTGLLEVANGGTLFLDEIGDMPAGLQSKLLVAIETGRFRRVGATQETQVDLRVVAATHCDLDERIKAGAFRTDLYHRLKMFEIELPPLRSRGDDLLLLADHFLRKFSANLDKPCPTLTVEAKTQLKRYPWPGNVRELAHVLLRVVTMTDETSIGPDHLHIDVDADVMAESTADLSFDFAGGPLTLAAVEKRLLQAAMDHADGNISEAARLLAMPRGTLRYRLEKLGLI